MPLTLTVMPALLVLCLPAQTVSTGPPPAKPATPTMRVESNLLQLMRGIVYPASNVIFSAQNDNPADVKFVPGKDPALATDPLASTFGGWLAVENAATALSESANLLLIPGRTCGNGVPVPLIIRTGRNSFRSFGTPESRPTRRPSPRTRTTWSTPPMR